MNRVRSPFFKLSLLLFAFCLPAGVQGQETKKEKADLVKQFDDLQNSQKNAFAGVGQDIKYLQAQINSLKENQSTYDAQLKALEERVKALESGTTKSPEDNGPEVVSKKPHTPPVPPPPPSPHPRRGSLWIFCGSFRSVAIEPDPRLADSQTPSRSLVCGVSRGSSRK